MEIKIEHVFPGTEEGRGELRRRAAQIHADFVLARLGTVPGRAQRSMLIERVLCSARKASEEKKT